MTLELRLEALGFDCWLDQKADVINKASMAAGVQNSEVFLLFLSEGVLSRPFCIFEIETALSLGKKIVLMHETDGRHGAFDFGAGGAGVPAAVLALLQTHESLPWRRRKYEQDTILQELIRLSGCSPSKAQLQAAVAAGAESLAVKGGGDAGSSVTLALAASAASTSCCTKCDMSQDASWSR